MIAALHRVNHLFVIADRHESGESGIHNHKLADMDSGLAGKRSRPGMMGFLARHFTAENAVGCRI
jgi:hypothetical protein